MMPHGGTQNREGIGEKNPSEIRYKFQFTYYSTINFITRNRVLGKDILWF